MAGLCCSPKLIVGSALPSGSLERSRMAVIPTGSPICCPIFCAPAIFAIACGYEDADDLDRLRFDPAFKLACGRLPDSGRDLCSNRPSRGGRMHPTCVI